MPLPPIHQLKPEDVGYVCHSDPIGLGNGFISRKLAARLRKAKGYANPEHFVCTDRTPWWNDEPLIEEYYVPPHTFVLILEGPCLLNGTEWFYRILTTDTTVCWISAFRVINVYPGMDEANGSSKRPNFPTVNEDT